MNNQYNQDGKKKVYGSSYMIMVSFRKKEIM